LIAPCFSLPLDVSDIINYTQGRHVLLHSVIADQKGVDVYIIS
jgi:hypothetical protein